MILKLQHNHTSRQSAHSQLPVHQEAIPQQLCPQFLKELLQHSQHELDKKSIKQIHQSILHRQKKVYSTLLPEIAQIAPHYLAVMFQSSSPSQQSYIKSLMGSRQSSIMEKIVNQEIQVKEQQDNDTKIKRIKNQLDQKIKSMKQEFGDLNISKIQPSQSFDASFLNEKQLSSNHSLMIIEDFKKKQYWKDSSFNEQGKRIKSFLSKMKRQKSQLESKYNKDLQNRFKKLQITQEQQRKKISEQKHQQYMENLQREYKNKTQQRKQNQEKKQSRIKEIQNFLSSLNSKQPIHLKYEKDFKNFLAKEQQNKAKILKEIKQKHPTYSPQEVEQHMNKYHEIKQKYNEEKQMKAVVEQEILSKRYQQIKQLYHSKHHQSLINPKKEIEIVHQSLTKNRQKVKQYANTVKESFKPQIDRKKKSELLNSIKLLELSQDPNKKKVVRQNGIIQFQDKPQNDAYQKGVSYLQQLRSINEMNKSRVSTSKRYQQRSNSALELTSPKKIDYLRESRPSLDLKPTISDWKNLLQKKDYTHRDKLQRVLDRAESLEIHAKQKQVQLRNMKRQSDDILSVRQESDKYYLESIAARMVLLKDVVMK